MYDFFFLHVKIFNKNLYLITSHTEMLKDEPARVSILKNCALATTSLAYLTAATHGPLQRNEPADRLDVLPPAAIPEVPATRKTSLRRGGQCHREHLFQRRSRPDGAEDGLE